MLRFDGDRELDLELDSVALSGTWTLDERRTLHAGVGLIVDGLLQAGGGDVHDLEPGGLVALGLDYLLRQGNGLAPFVDLSVSAGASWAKTKTSGSEDLTSYFATDLRLGVRAGWTGPGTTFPYVAARVFGGPVQWELDGADVTGTDLHHYQLGVGTAGRIGPIGVFIEWAGLGERSLNAGMSTSW